MTSYPERGENIICLNNTSTIARKSATTITKCKYLTRVMSPGSTLEATETTNMQFRAQSVHILGMTAAQQYPDRELNSNNGRVKLYSLYKPNADVPRSST